MRSLFRQASDYLKLRQTEIERLIEFPLSPSSSLSPCSSPYHKTEALGDGVGNGEAALPMGTRMRLEDSFNWKEFEQLYYQSDLFKWHRDYYTDSDDDGDDGSENGTNNEECSETVLDIDEMKAIWMENELAYEKAFSEGARKRLGQGGLNSTNNIVGSNNNTKRIVSTANRIVVE